MPLHIGIPIDTDADNTTVRELIHAIDHSDNYHMMAFKFGYFKYNERRKPTADEICVYTYCFEEKHTARGNAVRKGPGKTLVISKTELAAAGGTVGDLKALVQKAAAMSGESWAEHFYVGTKQQDLLCDEDALFEHDSVYTIPGLHDVQFANFGSSSEEQLAMSLTEAGVEDQDILQILKGDFLLNQREVVFQIFLDQASDDEDEDDDEEEDD